MYFDLMYETARQRCVGVLTKMFEVCSLESGDISVRVSVARPWLNNMMQCTGRINDGQSQTKNWNDLDLEDNDFQ